MPACATPSSLESVVLPLTCFEFHANETKLIQMQTFFVILKFIFTSAPICWMTHVLHIQSNIYSYFYNTFIFPSVYAISDFF
jgi:hypothetical protein